MPVAKSIGDVLLWRIETMMQDFEDSTISMTDNLSGLSYLVCAL